MTVRLVATDLDGTLVRSDGTVSERSRAALIAAEDAGIAVVLVTGRPRRWTHELFDVVGGHGLAIVSNGALVWDVEQDAPALQRPVEPEVGLAVADAVRTAVPGSAFAVETVAGLALEPDFLERHPVPDGARRGPLTEIFDRPALKLLARHETLEPAVFWERATVAAGDRVEVTWSSVGDSLLEISAAGVTKASTLAVLCERLGIGPDEVVALGDMPNDVPMLEWAGTSYAMADAHPLARAAADHTAASNDEDGVARVIEELVARGRTDR